MSTKSPDKTAETDECMEMLDWETVNKPVEEKDQKTLPDTESKLTNLNQELTAVRKDFEEYKATNDAKWEALESRKRQADGPEAEVLGLNDGPKGFSGLAQGALAKPKELADTLKIADLEVQNAELQSVIQANREKAELQNQKIRQLEATIKEMALTHTQNLKLKYVDLEREVYELKEDNANLNSLLRLAISQKLSLTSRLEEVEVNRDQQAFSKRMQKKE